MIHDRQSSFQATLFHMNTPWKLHHPPTPPSPSFTSQHAAASHSALFLFFSFPGPRARSCDLWASAGTRRLSDSRFSRQNHSWLIVLYFPSSSFFFGCRVLLWIKTCSFSARQPAAALIDSIWLLRAVNLICLIVKKERKKRKEEWKKADLMRERVE